MGLLRSLLLSCGVLWPVLSWALSLDITDEFLITRSGLVLNRASGTFDTVVTVENRSGLAMPGPVVAVVGGLPGTVSLANGSGVTADGKPYVSVLGSGEVLSGGATRAFLLKFANPQRVTLTSTLQLLYEVAVAADAPSLLSVVATGGANAQLVGRIEGAPSQPITLQVSSATTCVAGSLVAGAAVGSPVATTTDAGGYFSVAVAGVTPGTAVAVALAAPRTTPASACQVSSRDNDAWPKAFPLDSSGLTASDLIDAPGKARWYKFSVMPGQRIEVALTGLPADYDLVVFKDIQQAFVSQFNPATASPGDLVKLTAEYAPSTFSPSTFSPSTFSPDAYSPSTFSPSTFSPSTFSPSTFSPSTFSPSTFSPSTFSPSTFSPSTFSPSTFSPSVYTATEIAQAFSTAQTRSIIGVAATAGTSDERLIVNSWNSSGHFYLRVTGRGGAFDSNSAFTVDVVKGATTCTGVTDTALTTRPLLAASGLTTVLLTDSAKVALDTAVAGPAGETLRTKLTTFAARAEVQGVLIDVAGDARVSALKLQATNNPACPFAKNLVAEEIKGIVDSYRANALRYVVLVGNDEAIPFFRNPDQSALALESGYIPPVQSNSASEASLRRDFVLSQDAYGAKTRIALPASDFPVPGLAVGRLIETPAEIAGIIDAYAAVNGVVVPGSSLVTGYDFLEDAANAVRSELQQGMGGGGTSDALITPNGKSPQDPASWTASQLGDQLLGRRHDVIFLAGHFSANSALAADFATSLLTTDLAASSVDLANAIVFSAGCHSGYNLVDLDAIPGVTLPLDWAQAFARKQAALIAGTGYQYGDTDFLEYSERLYHNFARQLRAGTGAIAIGEALVKAKLDYLAMIPDIRGIHEKALLQATLFGLPMLGVNMPAGRGAATGGAGVITPLAVASGPAATLGLKTYDLNLAPSLTSRTLALQNVEGGPDIVATWLEGPDGVFTKPGEPALPLDAVNVTPTDASVVLRGVGLRGGTYLDSAPLVPFSGAPTTELRGVHVPFISPVFFPGRLWSANYFGALAGTGGTELLVTPAQHRVADLDAGTSTQRRYTGLELRLYYSGDLSQAALSDAPSIVSTEAQRVGPDAQFSVQVIGNPAAAIHQVWVTYSAEGTSRWSALDLVQCVAPLPVACASEDSRLWKGRLINAPANLRYLVQAVSGVGLVGLDDNRGAYYGLGVATPAATTLALIAPPGRAAIGESVDFTARLTYAGGGAVAGRTVLLVLGDSAQVGITGSDGSVTVRSPIAADPGSYRITASFAGDDTFVSSSATAAFQVSAAASSLVALAPAGATLTGNLGGIAQALPQETVRFLVSGPGGVSTIWATTDYRGRVMLPPPGLPAGTYTVTQASFEGNATYAPSSLALSQPFTVAKLGQSLTFEALPDRIYGHPAFAVFAPASSGLPAVFSASGACAVAGNVVQITGLGSCTITATQPGNDVYAAATQRSRTFAILADPGPTVVSLARAVPSPTMVDTVTYTLTFSEPVTGVAPSNFAVVTSGIAGASVDGVSGAGTTRTVTVHTGRGTGSLRLDVVNGAGILDAAGNLLVATPVAGETYEIDKGGTVIGDGAGRPLASFGNSGYALFSDVPSVNVPQLAVLDDGRVLAAGGVGCIAQTPSDPLSPQYCGLQLARFSENGEADASFGASGRVLTAVTNVNPFLSELIVNADGTFFATGSRHNGTAEVPFVAKFTSAGAPVAAFGTSGVVSLDSLPLGLAIVGFAIDGSDRILATGTTRDLPPEGNDIFVARLSATGALDPTFGSAGVARVAFSTVEQKRDRGTAVAVQPDGRIVVGGRTQVTPGLGYDFLLLRLDASGALDPSFGSGGFATTRFPPTLGNNLGRKLVLQPDGRIVLVGGVNLGMEDNQCGIARFNGDGTLDATFGAGGRVLHPVTVGCYDISRQPDGKLVIVAQDKVGDVNYGTLLRLLPSGALDADFGSGGVLDISAFGSLVRVAFTPDGDLVTGLTIQDPADGVLKSYVVELSGVPPAVAPQIFTVTNTNDSGSGSLREAVALANAAPGQRLINFAPAVTGTITLTTGQIRIDGPLTILGPGPTNLTIDGNLNGRIFTIIENNAPACPALSGPSDFLVMISGLTLQRGSRNVADSGGGAIQTSKSLVLADVVIRDSQAKSGGALVFNAQYPGQTLTITDSQFIDNVARPVVAGNTGSHSGGAIRVGNYCGGVRVPVAVSISSSVFEGNRVQPADLGGSGGAIAVFDDALVMISDTRIVDNHAEPNTETGTGHTSTGGGILTTTTSLTIERSEIAGNSAQFGGGIDVTAPGAAQVPPGATYAFLLINSTVSNNTGGGGVVLQNGVSGELYNSTVDGNVGAGVYYWRASAADAAPTLKLVSSVLGAGPGGGRAVALGTPFPPGPIDATNSLLEDICATCVVSGSGNLVGVDPLLGPLADNGGLTRTHALLPGSPAIDAGSNPFLLTTDQRGEGFPRVTGAAADMGAYESP